MDIYQALYTSLAMRRMKPDPGFTLPEPLWPR